MTDFICPSTTGPGDCKNAVAHDLEMRWTPIAPPVTREGVTYVPVRCACGTEREVRATHFNSGRSRSCGCLRRDGSQARFARLDRTRRPEDHLTNPTGTWKEIPGHPGYFASDEGRVFSSNTEPARELRAYQDRDGYFAISLTTNGREASHRVHRLVLLAFVGEPPPGKPITRHLDGNPGNNHLSNLTWGDNSENQRDRVAHGTDPNASRACCAAGHEYSPENTRWRVKNGRRSRVCRSCARDRDRRARAKAGATP